MGTAIKDKLVEEGLYDRETCDVMSDAEAETLWRLHQEIGQAFDAVCDAYAAILGLEKSQLSDEQRTNIVDKAETLMDNYDPTVLTGEKLKDDYCVFHEGWCVGRIMLARERSWQGDAWEWHVNPPLPIPPWCNGSAESLEEAKAEFRAAWERFYASLTPKQIEILQRTA